LADAVDSGKLRSSIRFDIRTTKNLSILTVSAFGVPYARMVEYGGPFTDKMRRAMFARLRDMGKPKRPGKGIIRAGHYQARPFLRPAISESIPFIRKTIRGLKRK
jgi:hypothetical protein